MDSYEPVSRPSVIPVEPTQKSKENTSISHPADKKSEDAQAQTQNIEDIYNVHVYKCGSSCCWRTYFNTHPLLNTNRFTSKFKTTQQFNHLTW